MKVAFQIEDIVRLANPATHSTPQTGRILEINVEAGFVTCIVQWSDFSLAGYRPSQLDLVLRTAKEKAPVEGAEVSSIPSQSRDG